MARQHVYPGKYPTGPYANQRAAAWDFLCLNQHNAAEMLAVWLESEFERVRVLQMARKAAAGKGSVQSAKVDWTGYANIDLSESDKAAIKGGVLDGETVLDILAEAIGTGHKITVSYDPQKDVVTGAITGAYAHCPNAGLTCTSFARSLTDVLTVMAYKHEIVSKGDYKPYTRVKRDLGDIG